MCHNLLSQSPLDEHLACFQPLAPITIAARSNTLFNTFAGISDEFQEMELLSQRVSIPVILLDIVKLL